MRRICAVVILAASAANGQGPTFEAASVKLDNSGSGSSSSNESKGQIVMKNVSLKSLIEEAYKVKPLQVTGPDWMGSVNVDITAKYPADSKEADRPLMLRALLEERFHLAVHHKMEERPGFALVEAKGGFKLEPATHEEGSGTSTSGRQIRTVKMRRVSMTRLADYLTRTVDQMVVDQTGIPGVYSFEMKWARDDQKPDNADETAPSLFTALQETLGLKLKPQKVPLDIIVVDHVDRVPVEN